MSGDLLLHAVGVLAIEAILVSLCVCHLIV